MIHVYIFVYVRLPFTSTCAWLAPEVGQIYGFLLEFQLHEIVNLVGKIQLQNYCKWCNLIFPSNHTLNVQYIYMRKSNKAYIGLLFTRNSLNNTIGNRMEQIWRHIYITLIFHRQKVKLMTSLLDKSLQFWNRILLF